MSDFGARWNAYNDRVDAASVRNRRLIDAHVHIGQTRYDERPLEPRDLIAYMDKYGVDESVLLPLESPEATSYYLTTAEVLAAAESHPRRIVPFCSVDPRMLLDEEGFRTVIKRYVDRGARGFGEVKAGVAIDDERMQLLYEICADEGLPILFHVDDTCCVDDLGLPGLERMLRSYPDVSFIMHAHGWWAHISADVRAADTGRYPTRPVEPGGRCDELLSEYDNLYADISMGSGFNAITRDVEYGREFLQRHHEKLLFGTDFLYAEQKLPQFAFFDEFELSEHAWDNVCHRNIERLLR
ncbi:amidohydrolase family protein (plasmid) [Haloferacaceae archaeon DSL9]